MRAGWTIAGLLEALSGEADRPAVIAVGAESTETVGRAELAARARAMAARLGGHAIAAGAPVALWAPNGAAWIAAALGVMAAGAVLVPIDDLADADQLAAALASSRARLLLTTPEHLATAAEVIRAAGVETLSLAAPARPSPAAAVAAVAAPRPEDPAVLLWTSGTTGAAKAFRLSHRNIATVVDAVVGMAIVGPDDRVLLPLPLHHAYPLVVGMLAALTCGTALVLPAGLTGPLLMRALDEGAVTTIVGVPRLYDAIVAAIEGRIAARGILLRAAWRSLTGLAILSQRRAGLRPGRLLFAPVRRAFGPRLRFLLSGGARLERETMERLEALGWTVLSGYGLAETASLFSGNTPGARRPGSAGRLLPGGEVRIAGPDAAGIGEIELRGPSITAGYLDNPAANGATFTPDGWFRTGDLGFVDRDGYLFVTGRAKELIVLAGGKKIFPEDLERAYGAHPAIREIAILENQGALVALVRPDPAKLQERGVTNLRDGIRVELASLGRLLPSYQHLSGFALVEEPLPRTRLGKLRRFMLPALYAQAAAGTVPRRAHALGAEDAALLQDATAAAVWGWLQRRFPGQAVDLDVSLGLDLALDSFAWMELTLSLQEQLGVQVADAELAGIDTIRDLLRVCRGRAAGAPAAAAPGLAIDVERWLAPTPLALTGAGLALYAVNRLALRGLFRLRVVGLERLPASGPFVIAPNHVSDLDPLVIAAALPLAHLRRLYWAGDMVRLFYNRASRTFCRTVHLFPVDEHHPDLAVATAARVLAMGKAQVWFPEGWRSPDGRLQRFMPGIGQLLQRADVPVVPAYIDGAFEALPRDRRIPRLRRLTIVFGAPETAASLLAAGAGRNDAERIAQALRERVRALAAPFGEPAGTSPA
jgi:long-chain acyl-CoA synthetase